MVGACPVLVGSSQTLVEQIRLLIASARIVARPDEPLVGVPLSRRKLATFTQPVRHPNRKLQ